LLLVFWSDEWNQYDYRGVKLRQLKMRVLNDQVIETHTIGVYPDGSLQLCPMMMLSPTDISVQEIYKQVVIPDVYQLENGIAIGSQFFVGTIHFIAGDHVELIDLGGLPGTHDVRHLCLISFLHRSKGNISVAPHAWAPQ